MATQKNAIMTLMCTNILNNVMLDAFALKSVQSPEEDVLKKESINKEISRNQQLKQINNEITKKLSDNMQKKLQYILKKVNKYKK